MMAPPFSTRKAKPVFPTFRVRTLFDQAVEHGVGAHDPAQFTVVQQRLDQGDDQLVGDQVDIGRGKARRAGLDGPPVPGPLPRVVALGRQPVGAVEEDARRLADIDIAEVPGLHRHLQGPHGGLVLAEAVERHRSGRGIENLHLLIEPQLDAARHPAGEIFLLGDDRLLDNMLGDPVVDRHGNENDRGQQGHDDDRFPDLDIHIV